MTFLNVIKSEYFGERDIIVARENQKVSYEMYRLQFLSLELCAYSSYFGSVIKSRRHSGLMGSGLD